MHGASHASWIPEQIDLTGKKKHIFCHSFFFGRAFRREVPSSLRNNMTTRKQSRREHEKNLCPVWPPVSSASFFSPPSPSRRGREDRLLHACPSPTAGPWPKPVQSANGAVVAIVQYPDGQGAVSVTVTPAPLPAKDLAVQTLNNMKSGAASPFSEPVASGRLLCRRILPAAGQGRQLLHLQRQARQRHHHRRHRHQARQGFF